MRRGAGRAWLRLRDPRVLLGIAISALTVWYSLRGVDFGQIGRAMAGANLPLLILPSASAHLLALYVRARRWRHLTDAVQPIPIRSLFRAVSIGFMANNVFPLRIGEVIRAWTLARETGASSAALLGTVIAERLIDVSLMLGLACVVLGTGGAEAAGLGTGSVLPALLVGALLPLGAVVMLRLAPARAIAAGSRISGLVLPARLNERLVSALHRIAEGLGALRGGRHLWWIALDSLLLWFVLALVPFLAAIHAVGIELGSPLRSLAAAYSVLIWVGLAVAVPSAPGFFGPYHFACWLALRPFGVEKEVAIALGTLSHAVFWVTVTGFGLLMLRGRPAAFEGLEAAAPGPGKDPLRDRR